MTDGGGARRGGDRGMEQKGKRITDVDSSVVIAEGKGV